ncbi:bifunctional dihydrofolate reductase-thymidylate synthase, partial [Genlisea aurea]
VVKSSLDSHSNGQNDSESVSKRTYQVVVAATPDMGIGKDGKLPWKLPGDLKFFKDITSNTSDCNKRNAVIMGRKTWESIPARFQPLPNRLNVVLTRNQGPENKSVKDVILCNSVTAALELLEKPPYSVCIEKIFVIGGGQILREALNSPQCDAIHMTEIKDSVECDTFIPPVDMSLYQPWYSSSPREENGFRYCFTTYVSKETLIGGCNGNSSSNDDDNVQNFKRLQSSDFTFLPKFIFEKHEEFQYLNMVQDIISNGHRKDDRTGTGTLSKFGCQMRFNLRKSFPLLTTKRVFWRGVVEELLWFISGSTNAKVLQAKGIHIWDGNASRVYLDSIGLNEREEGDLGPVYGFQWRHSGARYTNMHGDYKGQGFDQLQDVVDKIKNRPDDRRIVLSSWNPSDLKLMALPPCHMFSQFYVADGELSCQMYQRSADMGLGVPFNVASYALLTCMIAQVCELVPGELIHVMGDAHVYRTHVTPLMDQLKKLPRPFPVLKMNPLRKDIDSFVAADFQLIDYDPHGKIEMKMAL